LSVIEQLCELVFGIVLLLYAMYFACFGGSPRRGASKIGSSKKIKIIYSLVTNEYKALYSSVSRRIDGHTHQTWGGPGALYNRRIYEPTRQTWITAPRLSTFVGDVAPMNVASYIRQCHVTNEYNLNSSVPNTLGYVHRLTDEFMLYSSV
jgi:hypothetical protein